jgi:hypothetical protein
MTWSGIAGACLECNKPTGSEDRPFCRDHRWMEVKEGAIPELDQAVKDAIHDVEDESKLTT